MNQQNSHPGIKRTLYFARIVDLMLSKKLVKLVFRACEACQSIDPAPVCWEKGDLSVKKNWSRLAMNMTYHNDDHLLTHIDCGPSRFAIWWPLQRQDSTSIICQLEMIFYEWVPPTKILTNNDNAFTCRQFKEFVIS